MSAAAALFNAKPGKAVGPNARWVAALQRGGLMPTPATDDAVSLSFFYLVFFAACATHPFSVFLCHPPIFSMFCVSCATPAPTPPPPYPPFPTPSPYPNVFLCVCVCVYRTPIPPPPFCLPHTHFPPHFSSPPSRWARCSAGARSLTRLRWESTSVVPASGRRPCSVHLPKGSILEG